MRCTAGKTCRLNDEPSSGISVFTCVIGASPDTYSMCMARAARPALLDVHCICSGRQVREGSITSGCSPITQGMNPRRSTDDRTALFHDEILRTPYHAFLCVRGGPR